jgi:hypothetical protein
MWPPGLARPALVVAPLLDQERLPEDVRPCVGAAWGALALLGAPTNLRLETPNDFNRYPPRYQNLVNDWLWQVATRDA